MDADAHRRVAQSDNEQIQHWRDQIEREVRESQMRIQAYESEINNHVQDREKHLQTAAQLERDDEKRKERFAAIDRMTRMDDAA